MLKECQEVDFARKEVADEEVGKKLWEASEKQIEEREKEGAVLRALQKKVEEENEKAKAQTQTQKPAASGAKEQKAGSRRSRRGNGNK